MCRPLLFSPILFCASSLNLPLHDGRTSTLRQEIAQTGHNDARHKQDDLQFERQVEQWIACTRERDFNISRHVSAGTCTELQRAPAQLLARTRLPLQHDEQFKAYTFEDFVHDFNRTYQANTTTWKAREREFGSNKKDLVALRKNMVTGSWDAGITMFMDYTSEEYRKLLGLRVDRRKRGGDARNQALALHGLRNGSVPMEFTLLDDDKPMTKFVRDQGVCGSCWAAAATTTLEGVALQIPQVRSLMDMRAKALETPLGTLSSEAVVSCTMNPRSCGGTGGCDGATVELAYDMIKARGLPLAAEWPYTSGNSGFMEECDGSHFASSLLVTISGYNVLPTNDLTSLLRSLYGLGHPIAVSVDASHWNYYAGGVYSDLDIGKGDFTVNHAVTLVGFKQPPVDGPSSGRSSQGYYLIKNSWGSYFGESGFIRIEMKRNEAEHCGWDTDTHAGIACNGDPEEAWVCGTCGILYDSVYPQGVKAMYHNMAAMSEPSKPTPTDPNNVATAEPQLK